MNPDRREALRKIQQKVAAANAKPIERRVFLKFTGLGGLALACA